MCIPFLGQEGGASRVELCIVLVLSPRMHLTHAHQLTCVSVSKKLRSSVLRLPHSDLITICCLHA